MNIDGILDIIWNANASELTQANLQGWLKTEGLRPNDKSVIISEFIETANASELIHANLTQWLKTEDLSSYGKPVIIREFIETANANELTQVNLQGWLGTEGLYSNDKSCIIRDFIRNANASELTQVNLQEWLRTNGLGCYNKSDIITMFISNVSPNTNTLDELGELVRNYQSLAVTSDSNILDLCQVAYLTHFLQNHPGNEAAAMQLQNVVAKIPNNIKYEPDFICDFYERYILRGNFVSFFDKLIPYSPMIKAIIYKKIIENYRYDNLDQIVNQMIDSVGDSSNDINYMLGALNVKMLFQVCASSKKLTLQYGFLNDIFKDKGLSDVFRERELRELLNKLNLYENDISNAPAITLLKLLEIYGNTFSKRDVRIYDYLNDEFKQKLTTSFILPNQRAFLGTNEYAFLQIILPVKAQKLENVTFNLLCSLAQHFAVSFRDNDVGYKNIAKIKDNDFDVIKNENLSEQEKVLNTAFKEMLTSQNDAHKFIDAFIGCDYRFSEFKTHLKGEDYAKIANGIRSRKDDVKYLISKPDGLYKLFYNAAMAGDGCVANFASNLDKTIQSEFDLPWHQKIVYGALSDSFEEINHSNEYSDMLGGSSKVDFLFLEKFRTTRMNPVGMMDKLVRRIEQYGNVKFRYGLSDNQYKEIEETYNLFGKNLRSLSSHFYCEDHAAYTLLEPYIIAFNLLKNNIPPVTKMYEYIQEECLQHIKCNMGEAYADYLSNLLPKIGKSDFNVNEFSQIINDSKFPKTNIDVVSVTQEKGSEKTIEAHFRL